MHIQLHTYIKLFVCGEVSISFFLWFRLDEHSGGFGGGGTGKKSTRRFFPGCCYGLGEKKGGGALHFCVSYQIKSRLDTAQIW